MNARALKVCPHISYVVEAAYGFDRPRRLCGDTALKMCLHCRLYIHFDHYIFLTNMAVCWCRTPRDNQETVFYF